MWNQLRNDELHHISVHAARQDTRLMLANNRFCWTYKFCKFLHDVGYVLDARCEYLFANVQHAFRFTDAEAFNYFWALEVDEARVACKLKEFWTDRVKTVVEGQDPRNTVTEWLPVAACASMWNGLACMMDQSGTTVTCMHAYRPST
jgi:hypothetical protein